MLKAVIRENEDLVQPDQSMRFTDHLVDEGRVRRVTFYWYAKVRGNYGPNGFTADLRRGRDFWLVRACSGVTVKSLMPGAVVGEWELVAAARELISCAREEKADDQEHRRPESDPAGLGL